MIDSLVFNIKELSKEVIFFLENITFALEISDYCIFEAIGLLLLPPIPTPPPMRRRQNREMPFHDIVRNVSARNFYIPAESEAIGYLREFRDEEIRNLPHSTN